VAVLLEPWPDPAERNGRAARLCSVEGRGAVVLGSAQDERAVDGGRASLLGLDVARRHAGGGAVLVEPGAQVWLDVWMPRGDPLWEEDVVRSSWWLGEVWCDALRRTGVRGCAVHRGRATRTAWSDLVCFAGVGPGEVTVGVRKLVGLAQHRSRAGARLHTMAPVRWDPARLVACLRAPLNGRRDDGDDLALGTTGLLDVVPRGADGSAGDLVARHTAAGVVEIVSDALVTALA
jgi:lipoate-protein ligase A